MSIASEIERISDAKADLKAAINAKGGSLTNELIGDYAAAVAALPGGGGMDENAVHIYPATVDAAGIVTLTGSSTPAVADLAIGDQIVVDDLLYRKARQYETIPGDQSSADTHVIVYSDPSNAIQWDGIYSQTVESATGTARVWSKICELNGSPNSGLPATIEYNSSDSRWEIKENTTVQGYTTTSGDDPVALTWAGYGPGYSNTSISYMEIDSSQNLLVSDAGTTDVNGTYNQIDPTAIDFNRVWINFDTGARIYGYEYSPDDGQWFMYSPSLTGDGYEAYGGADPTQATWQQSIIMMGELPVPTVTASGGSSSSSSASSEVYDSIKIFNQFLEYNQHTALPSPGMVGVAGSIPTADASNLGVALIYVGATDSSYTQGHAYMCTSSSSAYAWTDMAIGDAAGMPVIALSSITSIEPKNGVVYTYTPASSDAFSFVTPTSGVVPTFELWLTQPSTAVTFSFTTTIWWDDGSGSYASTNSAPDMSTADTVYVLVFRYDGQVWLGNLAYSRSVVSA